jgi:hypothetical protein
VLVGLASFPLTADRRRICTICADPHIDLACTEVAKPVEQEGNLIAAASIHEIIEVYREEDAIGVECVQGCSSLGEMQCENIGGGHPKYSLFIHNGNVHAYIVSGREGQTFVMHAKVHRDYNQPDKLIIIRVTIR